VELSDDAYNQSEVSTSESIVFGFSADAEKAEATIDKDKCISGVTVDHSNGLVNAVEFHDSDGGSTGRLGGRAQGE